MAIRSNSLLSSSLLHSVDLREQEDPMGSMGNLMDVMLVFACGLMIALVARYNVDLSSSLNISGNIERLDAELEQVQEGIADSDSNYAEVGTVYRDIETGELYVVAPEAIEMPED